MQMADQAHKDWIRSVGSFHWSMLRWSSWMWNKSASSPVMPLISRIVLTRMNHVADLSLLSFGNLKNLPGPIDIWRTGNVKDTPRHGESDSICTYKSCHTLSHADMCKSWWSVPFRFGSMVGGVTVDTKDGDGISIEDVKTGIFKQWNIVILANAGAGKRNIWKQTATLEMHTEMVLSTAFIADSTSVSEIVEQFVIRNWDIFDVMLKKIMTAILDVILDRFPCPTRRIMG